MVLTGSVQELLTDIPKTSFILNLENFLGCYDLNDIAEFSPPDYRSILFWENCMSHNLQVS